MTDRGEGPDRDRGAEDWVAGIAATTITITPNHAVDIAGLGSPAPVSSGIDDPLDCTILVINTPGSDPLMLVALDLLYPGGPLRDRLERALAQWLPAENLLVFSSHTHAGPATDPTKPLLGRVSPHYLKSLTEQVLDAATSTLGQSRQDAACKVFTTKCELAVNRRERAPINVSRSGLRFGVEVTGSDPDGPVDPAIITAVLTNTDSGEPLAVVWNYACHPVGYPDSTRVTAHFPGVVRSRLREYFASPDLPVLFIQGFSGDLRPRATSTMRPSARKGLRWLITPGYNRFTPQDYGRWTTQLGDLVIGSLATVGTAVTGTGYSSARFRLDRTEFVTGSASSAAVTFASTTIGDDLRIVGVSAEPVMAYADWVRSRSRQRFVMLGGCMDDVFGYAPVARMLGQGAYEDRGFCPSFSCNSVSPGVEQAMHIGFTKVIGQ